MQVVDQTESSTGHKAPAVERRKGERDTSVQSTRHSQATSARARFRSHQPNLGTHLHVDRSLPPAKLLCLIADPLLQYMCVALQAA